mgnify:FL=1
MEQVKIMKEKIEYLKKYLKDKDIDTAIKELENGIPIQYIVGNVNFYGNTINVNSNVLIPRFETELLVDKTIKYIKTNFKNHVDILDIATGSGCIAITLKKEIYSTVDASDISEEALKVAQENALNNKVDINFINSDMLTNITKKYDIIISNPPYLTKEDDIMDIVKNNEPEIALYAKDNGLYYYDVILKNIKNNLKDKYLIAFEIGYTQGETIKNIALKYLDNINVKIEKDYSNKDRFVFIEPKI